jgi:hypothetical protein
MIDNDRMKALLTEVAQTHDVKTLLLRCAEWTADVIDDFSFQPVPMATSDIKEYFDIPPEDRCFLGQSYFANHPHVLNYFKFLRSKVNENKAIYEWLMQCRSQLLIDGQVDRAAVIDKKLKEVTVEQLTYLRESQ